MPEILLNVKNLRTVFLTSNSRNTAVDGIDITIGKGEIVSLVGESGCGKTAVALSLMKLITPDEGAISADSIQFKGRELLLCSEEEKCIRGKEMAIIFQEPMAYLNPAFTVGSRLWKRYWFTPDEKGSLGKGSGLLNLCKSTNCAAAYPHQLSGGMQQRVLIAMALACSPELLIADEPTTALDVTVQARIMELFRRLQQEKDMSVLLITHDLALVAGIASQVYVMFAGMIMEKANTREILSEPLHPYTRELLSSLCYLKTGATSGEFKACKQHLRHNRNTTGLPFSPALFRGNDYLQQDRTATRGFWPEKRPLLAVRKRGGIMPQLEVRDLKKYFYRPKRGGGTGIVRAVDGVAFALPRGETLGLVGESGCGKSTLARLILRLLVPDAGEIIYNGENIGRLSGKELLPLRRRMQIVFQNPFGSLNPQMTVGRALSEPLRVHCLAKSTKEIRQKTEELLVLVGLDKSFLERYPHELSGGQRQRIVLARALALQPEFIVCDEPVSALDVTSQAQIIALLERLREKLDLTMIFIAHDLRLVKILPTGLP